MPSIFCDKAREPDERMLAGGLGKAAAQWTELVRHLGTLEGVGVAWKFYGAKHGWQLKAVQGKRSVIYLVPNEGSFTAALALRPAGLELARASLPAAFMKEVEAAKPGPEGHPARVLVKTKKELAIVRRLLEIKLG